MPRVPLISVLLLVSGLLGSRAHALTTVTVDHVEDDAANACLDEVANDCSLRGAIVAANGRVDPTSIHVPAGTYTLTGAGACTWQTTRFGSSTSPSTIPLCFAGPITLIGAGADATIIDAAQRDRAMLVGNNAPVEIRGVAVRNGAQRGGSVPGGGGAINASGDLTLVDVDITDSFADVGGGGLYNSGAVRMLRTRLLRNIAAGSSAGGGLSNDDATARIADSQIADNRSGVHGGGIFNFIGTVEVNGGAIHDNETNGLGGGIGNFGGNHIGAVSITNTTISGNHAGGANGGGIYNGQLCTLDIRSATITDNEVGTAPSAAFGGGVANTGGSSVTFANSVIAGNRATGTGAAPDCYGAAPDLQSSGHNLFQDVTLCGRSGLTDADLVGVAPLLAPLADNGGFSPTHALIVGSPAIDAGDAALPGSGGSACPVVDQRGVLRPVGVACDMGAFERAAGLELTGLSPARGGDTGLVTAVLTGSGFAPGASVRLVRSGQTDIVGDPVAVDPGGASLTTRFDLAGRSLGAWDLAVTIDTVTRTLPGVFSVEPGRAPALWVNVLGRNGIRPGRRGLYTIAYGNRGNVDAAAVPLPLDVGGGYALTGLFPVAPPPAQPGQIATEWVDVPVSVFVDAHGDVANVPLLLPVVPAGFAGILRFALVVPAAALNDEVVVAIGKPWLLPELDPTVVDSAVAGAQAYAERSLGTTLPEALLPQLRAYAVNQVQLAVAHGRDAFVVSSGREPEVYSIAQLTIDLALYGQSLADAMVDADPSWQARASRLFARLVGAFAATQVQANPCSGGVLKPGESCAPGETHMPPPDGPGPPKPLTPAECHDIRNHSVSTDGKWCMPNDRKKCPPFQNPVGTTDPDCSRLPIGPKNSVDPNDKVGPQGAGTPRWIGGTLPVSYTVLFENLETATASAQEVVITDQLDVAHLDLTTLALGPITFGNVVLQPPPAVRSFTGGVDLRPAQPLLVKVDAGIDDLTGVLTWRFAAIDPETGQLTDDPDLGFLPANVAPPAGEGSVSFTITPKAGIASGTVIPNGASIVFDTNAPLLTPTWENSIDRVPPSSAVTSVRAVGCTGDLLVRWAGEDAGAGVATYDVLVSDNGAPPTLWREATPDTEGTFPGVPGHAYAFTSVAIDGAGNREAALPVADRTITADTCTGHDLAVVAIKVPKVVKPKANKPPPTVLVRVQVQNRGGQTEGIPDLATLAALVRLDVTSLGACPAPVSVLVSGKPQTKLPATVKSKKKLNVVFAVTLACANDAGKGAGHQDFQLTATVDHGVLGGGDLHPEDDVCPRQVPPPGVKDPNPDGKILDKGCGTKRTDKTFGDPVFLDLFVK